MDKLSPDSRLKTLDYLNHDFVKKLQRLYKQLRDKGVEISFGSTLIGPKEQGRMWCAGVTESMMQMHKSLLIKMGADKLAQYLVEDWCELEATRTQHLPGASWHNHGQAVQVFARIDDEAAWKSEKCNSLIIQECINLNLHHGTRLRGAKKLNHIQYRPQYSPFLVKHSSSSWKDIQKEMSQRFDLD